jgi:CRISPR/Cas system-associated endonuclease Cas1
LVLHSDKPGRVSLAYDGLEWMRTRIDTVVFEWTAGRIFLVEEFELDRLNGTVRLSRQLARLTAVMILGAIPFKDDVAAARKIAAMF